MPSKSEKITNPFTKHLSQGSDNTEFLTFVAYWDRLERVVINVYRQKTSLDAAEQEFDAVWTWLRQHYPKWKEILHPYWQATRAAGEPTKTDPFKLLLDIARLEEIPGNWRAMQHLPAGREAINRYILDLKGEPGKH